MSDTPRNTRSGGRRNDAEETRRKPQKTLVMLISCCLFLFIVCSCLLAALVLIGKHFVYNSIAESKPHHQEENVTSANKRPVSRLPSDTRPVHYNLTLIPRLDTGLYEGKVNITLEIDNERNNIVLHSLNLSIDTVDLISINGYKTITVQNILTNEYDETVVIVPKEQLVPGLYFLFIKYSGSILHKIVGFYKSKYLSANNETR